MPKYDQLSAQLRVRIHHGDYELRSLPPERQLAVEHGVSYMTARKALQHLIDDGILRRAPNGRVEVNREHSSELAVAPIALLSPAFSSPGFDGWRSSLSQLVKSLGGVLRQELYTHWDDPIFTASMGRFSGVFLLPSSEEMPRALVERLSSSERPLVVLDDDLSGEGIPSIRQVAPSLVRDALDHLKSVGCRSINCLNVQPMHSVIESYLAQWRAWTREHGIPGEVINEPVAPYEQPHGQAYHVMKSRLEEGPFTADALFCVTAPAAIGAMRAMHEAGIRPGYDVAVSTLNGEGYAELQIPSLTAMEPADVTPQLKACIQWMMKGGPWRGELLMQPAHGTLRAGESTTFFAARGRAA